MKKSSVNKDFLEQLKGLVDGVAASSNSLNKQINEDFNKMSEKDKAFMNPYVDAINKGSASDIDISTFVNKFKEYASRSNTK